ATAKGEVDASGIRGVDADLVVKPFGWKGTAATFADFASDALQVHMGIHSDVLLASASHDVVGDGNDPADPDGDGVRGELGRGPYLRSGAPRLSGVALQRRQAPRHGDG